MISVSCLWSPKPSPWWAEGGIIIQYKEHSDYMPNSLQQIYFQQVSKENNETTCSVQAPLLIISVFWK